ncbi:MAG: hypothetical protein PVJ84_18740 [Desulfobacteraceae bacterium]|jgi:hypothetical protein
MGPDVKHSSELFKNLKALSDASFPKRCAMCGQEYASVKEYVEKTQDVSGQSGLKKGYDDDDKPIVELFRNCVCGSTLMDCFSDRRDVSDAGLKRRKLFGKLIDIMISKGVEAGLARQELLKVMQGEHSAVLEKLGVNTESRTRG